MSLKLSGIKAVGEDKYQVTLTDETGATEIVVCRVFKHKGISAIRMEPDIVMTNQPPRIDSRAIAQAVLAYHQSLVSPGSEQKH